MPEGSPEKAESDRTKRLLFEASAAFGAHHIKAGNIPARVCEFDQLAEVAGSGVRRGERAHGREDRLRDHPVRPSGEHPGARSRSDRSRGRAEEPGAGDRHLAHVQAGHRAREAGGASTPSKIAWVELSDGHFHNLDDFVYEVTCDRRLPGEGEFDIPGYVTALQAAGYEGPWGVEVLSVDLRSLPFEETFQRAYETTNAQFSAGVA